MKQIFTSLIIGFCLLTNCQSDNIKKEKVTETNNVTETEIKREKRNINDLSDCERNVYDFYMWYLGNIYLKELPEIADGPNTVIVNGQYAIDNKYTNFLKQASQYLSHSFVNREFERIRVCDSLLKTLEVDKEPVFYKWTEFSNEIQEKYFESFNSIYWVKGQGEQIDSVEIVSSSLQADTGNVIVKMLAKPSDFIQFVLKVNVIKENKDWKIDKISFK
jgi:hypothetical protein